MHSNTTARGGDSVLGERQMSGNLEKHGSLIAKGLHRQVGSFAFCPMEREPAELSRSWSEDHT